MAEVRPSKNAHRCGKPLSEATKAKIAAKMRGRSPSIETRQKMSMSQIAKGIRPEARAAMAAGQRLDPKDPTTLAMVKMRRKGASFAAIGRHFNLGHWAVQMRLRRIGKDMPRAKEPQAPKVKVAPSPATSAVLAVALKVHPALRDSIRCIGCNEPFEKHWRSTVRCRACFGGKRA